MGVLSTVAAAEFNIMVEQFIECSRVCHAATQTERDAATTELNRQRNKETAGLQKGIAQLQDDLAASDMRLQTSLALQSTSESQKAEIQVEMATLSEETEELKKAAQQLRNGHAESLSSFSSVSSQLQGSEAQVLQLESELVALQLELADLSALYADNQHEATSLHTESYETVTHLQNICNNLQLNAAVDTKRVAELEDQLTEKKSLEDDLQAKIRDLFFELGSVRAECGADNEQKQQLQSEFEQKKSRIETLSGELGQAEDESRGQLGNVVEELRRAAALRKVYSEFDFNVSGQVGETELLELGRARLKLGGAATEWTDEHSRWIAIAKMGTDGHGTSKRPSYVC